MIVGLGNPGPDYERTRHNYGYSFLDRLCRKWSIGLSSTTPFAVFEEIRRKGNQVVLVKPTTYMNRSGAAVGQLLHHFRSSPGELIVAHDELDLPFGTVKMRRRCGPGSHNGVGSIVEELSDESFGRIRFGIGPRPEGMDGADFVLSNFHDEERPIIEKVLDWTVEGIEILVARGFDHAMNHVNQFRPDLKDEGEGSADRPIEGSQNRGEGEDG